MQGQGRGRNWCRRIAGSHVHQCLTFQGAHVLYLYKMPFTSGDKSIRSGSAPSSYLLRALEGPAAAQTACQNRSCPTFEDTHSIISGRTIMQVSIKLQSVRRGWQITGGGGALPLESRCSPSPFRIRSSFINACHFKVQMSGLHRRKASCPIGQE